MVKSLWIIGGTLCVGLGALGVLLPVLPTTPFLLLAAYCYGRGSERFHHWLVHRSWLGSYIRNFQSGRGVPLKQKVFAITLLWLTIGATIGFTELAWWVKATVALVGVGVTIHLVKMKTWHPEYSVQDDKQKTSASPPLKAPSSGLPAADSGSDS